MPRVTVLLSVYNDLRFLPAAAESVLGQTFGDFELLAIDDGSADGSGKYLDSLADPRVRVIHNTANLGLTASLNLGLDAAAGQYIARMDADDICEPDRLRRQVEFLDANPDVGIVGSSRRLIDVHGNHVAIAQVPASDTAIRWKCLLGCPFGHPTVMIVKSVLDEHGLRYDPAFRTAQDYELWTRLLQHTHGASLPEPLLHYRLRDGVSKTNKPEQLANHDRIAHAACQRLLPGLPLTAEQVRQLRGRYGGFSVREPDMNPADEQWIQLRLKMLEEFASSQHLSADSLAEARAAILSFRVAPSPAMPDHRDPRKDLPDEYSGAAIVAGIGAAATVVGFVFVSIMATLTIHGIHGTNQVKSEDVVVTGSITVGTIGFWGWILYHNRRSRPFLIAVLIGFGVGFLIEGACFAINSR